ncbi:hypothetical protein [Algibacillus agarilyticus]|nr:hypothetical protein [Algibacillus agarilyticus]
MAEGRVVKNKSHAAALWLFAVLNYIRSGLCAYYSAIFKAVFNNLMV